MEIAAAIDVGGIGKSGLHGGKDGGVGVVDDQIVVLQVKGCGRNAVDVVAEIEVGQDAGGRIDGGAISGEEAVGNRDSGTRSDVELGLTNDRGGQVAAVDAEGAGPVDAAGG
jgi:hypothetical protein